MTPHPSPPEAHAHLGTTYHFPGCLFSTPHKVSTEKFSYGAPTFQVRTHAHSGVQYPFPKNLSLNFNELPTCFWLSHPKIPSSPKSGKQSGGLWEELGLLPVTGAEQVPSLPVADKVVLCVLCSWTLMSLGAHRYSAIACLSICLPHGSGAQPCLKLDVTAAPAFPL